MVYDGNIPVSQRDSDKPGYTIFEPAIGEDTYELYTDDGKGNGDHVCSSMDKYWITRIAHALDEYQN